MKNERYIIYGTSGTLAAAGSYYIVSKFVIYRKTMRLIYTSLFFIFTFSFQYSTGQTAQDSVAVREKILLEYVGDYIPMDTINTYGIFFDKILSGKKTTLKDIDRVDMFPVGLQDPYPIRFDYCVLNYFTLAKNNKAHVLVFVLDSSFNVIDSKKLLWYSINNGKKVYRIDILSAGTEPKAVFKVLNLDTNSQDHSRPIKIIGCDYYYLNENKIAKGKEGCK